MYQVLDLVIEEAKITIAQTNVGEVTSKWRNSTIYTISSLNVEQEEPNVGTENS
jgi:hypothetical protein